MASTAAASATTTMQLEFRQAMTDFQTMFPDMEKEVIEAVLRSNQGAVDATIDQLLTMSTDNQNEKLRNELEKPAPGASHIAASQQRAGPSTMTGNIIDLSDDPAADSGQIRLLSSTPLSPAQIARSTGASPKIKAPSRHDDIVDSILNCDDEQSQQQQPNAERRWRPALLGPLPPGFLRLGNEGARAGATNEFDIPDEQFALMLQNEEFMNELRWNPEFMCALEKEHQQQQQQQQQKNEDGTDVAQFRERLRHMGKRSRKKFAMLARVFTWQRHKKPGAVRHPDSLPLREEHSDDDDGHSGHQQRGRVRQ